MSQVNTNAIYDASGGQSAKLYGVSMRNGGTGWVNRIINGDMRIDQRNVGASVTVNTGGAFYAVDRFRISAVASAGVFTGQRVTDAPAEFNSSMKVTVTTADASLAASDAYYCLQDIEGNNVTDFKLGTANAITFTLSFWVKSSLTGTFGASFSNNDVTRSYPFSYTVNAANTWEKKTVTVAGDTTGTWDTGTGRGLRVIFSLGVGSDFTGTADQWNGAFDIAPAGAVNVMATNAATWQITGVQLEAGSVATPFERRDYGRELMMCQRYYEKSYPVNVMPGTATVSTFWMGIQASSQYASIAGIFATPKRAAPTLVIYNPSTGATGSMQADATVISAVGSASETGLYLRANNVTTTTNQFLSGHWTASAEL